MTACPACGVENPEGSRFCNACGERFPVALSTPEVRKTVTVVFCDVTGSTALGERLDAEALRRVMIALVHLAKVRVAGQRAGSRLPIRSETGCAGGS
jgi:hypothetical protein